MKKLDVKSFVTIAFTIALIVLLFITVFKSEDIFSSVFLLFTNLCTAVFTYFFTKKKGGDEVDRTQSSKRDDT